MTRETQSSGKIAALPRMTVAETVAVLAWAGGPLFAKGVIVRRPWVVALLQATGLEWQGVSVLQDLRRRYGEGPVLMRLPWREQAIVLSPDHLRRVLDGTPEPFQSDSSEKHATLAHFEPAGSLISRGADRQKRRLLNEQALQSGCPMHGLATRFSTLVGEEIAALSAIARRDGKLDWGTFKDGWFRIVRRCLFGDAAADDADITAMLIRLRGDANWAFLHPKRQTLRARFLSRVASYLHKPEPDTLALLASRGASARARPEDQIGQWLFAFDAAGIATFRTLAILVSSETLAKRARRDDRPDHPFIRACLLEAIRLWPTTPAILRQTDRKTDWGGAVMPEGTGLLIHVPFFHRDDERLPFAHRFAPDLWLDDGAEQMALVPFSAGPGECPAKDLVLMLGSMTIASLLRQKGYRLAAGLRMTPDALPATFDHFSLALQVQARD